MLDKLIHSMEAAGVEAGPPDDGADTWVASPYAQLEPCTIQGPNDARCRGTWQRPWADEMKVSSHCRIRIVVPLCVAAILMHACNSVYIRLAGPKRCRQKQLLLHRCISACSYSTLQGSFPLLSCQSSEEFLQKQAVMLRQSPTWSILQTFKAEIILQTKSALFFFEN